LTFRFKFGILYITEKSIIKNLSIKEIIYKMARKILVVDDERHIARLIQVNLERVGYIVITAENGKEALEKIESDRPELVILDVMMPVMDGLETLKTIRATPGICELPIIMLTAKTQDQDVFRGYSLGVDIYLTKPFNPAELIGFVKRVFDDQQKNAGGGHVYTL